MEDITLARRTRDSSGSTVRGDTIVGMIKNVDPMDLSEIDIDPPPLPLQPSSRIALASISMRLELTVQLGRLLEPLGAAAGHGGVLSAWAGGQKWFGD